MELRIKKKEINTYGVFPGAGVLLSPFAKILSAILFAGLLSTGVFSVFKVLEVKNLQIAIAEEKNNTLFVAGQLNECRASIEAQNNKLIAIRADAERDINDIKSVNNSLEKLNKTQRAEIEKLRNRPAPQGCVESENWLRDNLDIFEKKQ